VETAGSEIDGAPSNNVLKGYLNKIRETRMASLWTDPPINPGLPAYGGFSS